MANTYYSWINQEFSNTKIVFDHFHVIKLMNDKLDKARRRVTAKLNIIQQKKLNGLRFIFLKNNENLPEDAKINDFFKNLPSDNDLRRQFLTTCLERYLKRMGVLDSISEDLKVRLRIKMAAQ